MALPIHRHSLPQIAVDAVFSALAYYLAYRLRFDGTGDVPPKYDELFVGTVGFVIAGNVAVFIVSGLYRHWNRYASQREYLLVARSVLLAVLALVVFVVVVQPSLVRSDVGDVSVNVPTGVLVLYGLILMLFMSA